MHPLSAPMFIISRLAHDWKLLLSIFVGVTISTALIAGAPLYVKTLERQGINTAIDRATQVFLDIYAFSPHIPLDESGLQKTDQVLERAIQDHISPVYGGRERHFTTPGYLVGVPGRPLPLVSGQQGSQGFFQYLSNLERHVEFVQGRMSTDIVSSGPRGPVIEAVVGNDLGQRFGLSIGDVVTLTPSLDDPTRVSAKVVGLLEPTDPSDAYWQENPDLFLRPEPLGDAGDPNVIINPEELPLALFITMNAMVGAVGPAFPGTLVNSSWFISVDKERLKGWSMSEARARIDALEMEMSISNPGSTVLTGLESLLDDFEHRSFFASVPLLLLLTIMVMTVFYYLAMMVSYLVQSRESDVALLRSRGVGTLQLLRLYAMEGAILTGVAVVVAPFLALGAVALAGKLPYFREITGGDFLPVELSWVPFLVALGAGLLGLAIFVIPGVVGARTGLVIHRLRSSRPPSVPFFQRYYLDLALLAVGGLVFWELRERGELISGGLFKEVQVNEALLLAPVIFLTVVALLFMRVFPLFVRFISGESRALLHLVVVATLITLAAGIGVQGATDDGGLAWILPVALLVALAGAYWATYRAQLPKSRNWLMVLQAGLVALVMMLEPPEVGEFTFVPSISLAAMIPAQLMFLLFAASVQAAPVWMSMGLWHMARNPLQYSWLVLLLVMVTGLGILATTVGGTLDRSYEERVLYDVAADIRVTGVPGFLAPGSQALKELYLTIPGVRAVSLGLRGSGSVGASAAGDQFRLLAVESEDFPYMSWYRDDFSAHPLPAVMRALQSDIRFEPLIIPDGATTIGTWAKPDELYSNMFLWVVIQDARGIVVTVTLGTVGRPQWHLMAAEIPSNLEPPLELVSVQLYEPGFGAVGTPGSILLDDIHVTFGSNGQAHTLEDFENPIGWTPLATSALSGDRITATREESYQGVRAGLFSFGKETSGGIRGFYRSPSGGPMSVVASSSFLAANGYRVGDAIVVQLENRILPAVVRDVVDYFPTLNPAGGGFVLADLDTLLRHLNMLGPTSRATPNELFIAEAAGAGSAVRDVVLGLSASAQGVHDRELLMESIRLNPLITAGWRAMAVLAVGIIVFTAGLGYVTYLLSFAERSRSEMGFLRSLGLDRRQIMGLLSFEHLVIVIVGLGLGSWAGFQMSNIMVSSVAVTETGRRVIPPFILTTDWSVLLPIFAALVVIFLAALIWLTRSTVRQDLTAISRLEGH